MLENGPIHVLENGTIVGNPWSWDKLVDYVFVDQPVYLQSLSFFLLVVFMRSSTVEQATLPRTRKGTVRVILFQQS